MAYEPLIQNPMSIDMKTATSEAKRVFRLFVERLNKTMADAGYNDIWYQPDNSKWPERYFWMFHYKSEKRDFITRVEFVSKRWVQVDFSHFGARRPEEVEFMPEELFQSLEYKGFPPHVRMGCESDLEKFAPLIGEHYLRILNHLKNDGKLVPRGWSHIEVALKAFLKTNDSAEWTSWDKLDFLGRREVDLACSLEKIAIEVQGDYWHRLEGSKEKDEAKRQDLLNNGWSLIWAWESGIRQKFHVVLEALDRIRSGERFIEIERK